MAGCRLCSFGFPRAKQAAYGAQFAMPAGFQAMPPGMVAGMAPGMAPGMAMPAAYGGYVAAPAGATYMVRWHVLLATHEDGA